jgi:2-polyprenyl-3-methyl-5-hydroxy-6-metoxy-1,4-benzoquinol methylase
MDIVERLTLEAAQADTMIASEHRQRYQLAAELVPGARVLDLCCGSGYGAEIMAARAARVTGVDNDAATVETARATVGARADNVSFEVADALAFLRRRLSERFEVVVCFEGLEHMRELEAVLERLAAHALDGLRILASVPNDRLSDIRNPHHHTQFGYGEAMRAFAGFPQVRMLPQFLAEGAVICPPKAGETEVQLALGERLEPQYANHFIFACGFEAAELERAHRGRLHLSAAPIFNRWSEDLKRGADALRRENARLGRTWLGRGGSAAPAALQRFEQAETREAQLGERLQAAEARVAELEATLAELLGSQHDGAAGRQDLGGAWRVIDTVDAREAQAIPAAADGETNSWEHRYRRAAEVLIPWLEQAVALSGRTVLEYGCGNAAVSCALAERAGRVIGLDIDEQALAEGRARLRQRPHANVELHHHPPERIMQALARHRGEVDVLVLYAVLEHLTVAERLELLALARQVVPPEGAIVVCETPNRLIYFDHHTARLPFFHLLPDELALELHERSPRADFRAAIAAAREQSHEAALEAIARWGRGVSFHEFEAAFGERLGEHVLASSWDPLLLGERPVHPEEVILARYLERARPDLDPAWSRYWLDLVLSPVPLTRRPARFYPWSASTAQSSRVGWTEWENLLFQGPGATLVLELPHPTERLLLVSVTLDGRWAELSVRAEAGAEAVCVRHRAGAGAHALAVLDLPAPAQRIVIEASERCHVVLVGYQR